MYQINVTIYQTLFVRVDPFFRKNCVQESKEEVMKDVPLVKHVG